MQQSKQPDDATTEVGRTKMIVSLAVLIGVGAFIRFDSLSVRDIWLDESCTFYATHNLLDWPEAGPDRVREVAHGPYFLLLRAWTSVAGETAAGLRSFSAFVGCLTIPVIAMVGVRLGGRRAGLIAAALVAVHPLHIYYSQEARVYTLWALVAAVTLYALVRAAQSASARWWVTYGATVWCLVLTHYYSLLWLPATIAVLFVVKDRRRVFRQWLITHVLLAVSLVPLILFVVLPNAATGPKVWLSETWSAYPPILALPRSIWALLPSGSYPSYLGRLHAAPELLAEHGSAAAAMIVWAPALLGAVLVLAGGVLYRAPVELVSEDSPAGLARTATTRHVPAVRFLLGSTALFMVVAWAYSFFVRPAYVVGRYDVIALPAVILALTLLINAMPTAWQHYSSVRSFVPLAITAALCGCSLLTVAASRAGPVRHIQQDRARRIATHVSEDDLVVSMNLYRWFMAHEWHQQGFAPRVVSFPPAHDRQLCWDDAPAELTAPATIEADIDAVVSRISAAFATGDRVWLLAHGEPAGPRWEVDRRFFARLRSLGIDVQLVDDTVGLARLMPTSDDQGHDAPAPGSAP